tara:strand:- start:5036 stop:5461 length:426 start_codon:yes stop_codon:yes gene_type:complete
MTDTSNIYQEIKKHFKANREIVLNIETEHSLYIGQKVKLKDSFFKNLKNPQENSEPAFWEKFRDVELFVVTLTEEEEKDSKVLTYTLSSDNELISVSYSDLYSSMSAILGEERANNSKLALYNSFFNECVTFVRESDLEVV